MNRVKHLTALIIRVVFILLVFVATMVMMSMQSYAADQIPIARDFDEDNIDILTENGATVSWEIVDGELVFDITQSGEKYDDIAVILTFNKVEYDTAFLRSMLGDDAGEHEEFISEMESGPWLGHYNFHLKGESFFTTDNGSYTFTDAALGEYIESVVSSGANESTQTESFTVNNGDEYVTAMLIFGSEKYGALESGRYTLKMDLKLGHPEGKQLDMSLLETAGMVCKLGVKAVGEAGLDIFNVTNWLTFYGVMIILGWFIYLWRDLRSMAKIFSAIVDGDGTTVIVKTYVNGYLTDEHTETNGGNPLVALILTMLCYIVFLVTIPIRMLIHIVRDIVYLFKEDYDIEAFSFLGNFLGSVGIYALLVGIVGLLSASYIVGGVGSVLGLALCISAHFICKRREEDYG